MGFLDIRGLSPRQKSGGKGWNPANGVPFCARAYICRPRPWGWLGGFWMQGSASDALSTIRCGPPPPISAHAKREKALAWNPSKSTFRASPAPRGHRPPSGGKFELLQPRARRKHVISAPRRELRTPVLLTTKQLLWLPRSARRADGAERRSRAARGEAGD